MSDAHGPYVPSHAGGSDEVALVRLPPGGILRVIFLGPIRSVLCHFINRTSVHCPGKEKCKGSNHAVPITWAGFAPVEFAREHPRREWVPGVVQVTFRLYGYLGSDNPRGEVWDLSKRPYRGSSNEIFGNHIRNEDPRGLRTDVAVEPVVYRLLKTTDIVWDRPPPFAQPQVLPTRPIEAQSQQASNGIDMTPELLAFNASVPKRIRDRMIKEGRMQPDPDDQAEGNANHN